MSNGKPSVNSDGRACIRHGRLPRPRPDPRVHPAAATQPAVMTRAFLTPPRRAAPRRAAEVDWRAGRIAVPLASLALIIRRLMFWRAVKRSLSFDPRRIAVSMTEQPVEIDGEKLQQFVFRAVDEVGATLNAALVVMGDRLGLYRALAGTGGLSAAELAVRTGTAERYVLEWLNAQAAGDYVAY